MLFGDADLKDFEFPLIQADTSVELTRAGIFRFRVRQEDLGWAVFQYYIRDLRIGDVADLLRGHNHYCVLTSHGLQPILETIPKQFLLKV